MPDDPTFDSANIQTHPAFTGAAEEMAEFADGYERTLTSGSKETTDERLERQFAESRKVDDPPAETAAEPVQDDPAPLVFGKYKDLKDAEDAYWKMVKFAKDTITEKNAVLAQTQTSISNEPDPVMALEEYGVPPEVAKRAMKHVAAETVREFFTPMLEDAKAENAFANAHEDYASSKRDFERFLLGNPEVAESVESARESGQHLLAREWAWMKFQQTQSQQVASTAVQDAAARKQVVEEAKKDAAVGARRNDARSPKSNELTEEEFERLKEMHRNGHSSLLWRNTIGTQLADELFR